MQSPIERYLAHLDNIFQVEPEFFPLEPPEPGMPKVTAIVYRDVPETGSITGLTWGVSRVPHPDWRFGRPELIISVDSADLAWPLAIADLANSLRGKCPFSYGDVINFGEAVSEESDMSAFFIFAPSILERSDFLDIDVGDYKVSLAGLYPIYDAERAVISQIGLEAFWVHPSFDMYNVTRYHVAVRHDSA